MFLIVFNVFYCFRVAGIKFQAVLRIFLVKVEVGGEHFVAFLVFFIVYMGFFSISLILLFWIEFRVPVHRPIILLRDTITSQMMH